MYILGNLQKGSVHTERRYIHSQVRENAFFCIFFVLEAAFDLINFNNR